MSPALTDEQAQSQPDPNASPFDSSTSTSTRKTISTLPDETLAFAARVFDLARSGDIQTLSTYLDAGLPPNLTNDKGMYIFLHSLSYLLNKSL